MVSFACEKYEMFLLQFIYEKQQQNKKNLYTKKSLETLLIFFRNCNNLVYVVKWWFEISQSSYLRKKKLNKAVFIKNKDTWSSRSNINRIIMWDKQKEGALYVWRVYSALHRLCWKLSDWICIFFLICRAEFIWLISFLLSVYLSRLPYAVIQNTPVKRVRCSTGLSEESRWLLVYRINRKTQIQCFWISRGCFGLRHTLKMGVWTGAIFTYVQ